MTNKFTHSPVFPIVPCYDDRDYSINLDKTVVYLKYLKTCGAKIFITTAGTTQFNLMTDDTVYGINDEMFKRKGKETTLIMGLKPQENIEAVEDIRRYVFRGVNAENLFFLLKYPDRYYNDSTIVSYCHTLADYSDFPCLIHCSPLQHGTNGGQYDYTAKLINAICEHDNIVGITEEASTWGVTERVKRELSADIGIIYAGGSQNKYRFLEPHHNSTFLAGIGSMFPQLDIKMNSDAENLCFDVFFEYGWHPSLRYALQYLKLIPEYNRQPWPEWGAGHPAHKDIRNVVDEIKEMV